MLLYLHGFESSPISSKAQAVEQLLAERPESSVLIPQLPYSMRATKNLLDQIVKEQPITAVMGSSLGGFWTHYVASQLGCRGVLINPAVAPGPRFTNYPRERYHPYLKTNYLLSDDDVAALAEAGDKLADNVDLLVLLQRADETLDYRDAAQFYQHQRLIIEVGGDHRFVGFERYLPTLLEFLKVL